MAAKKTALKKAAKKAAKKGAKHHGAGELRRAYEHLGRLEALQGGLTGAVVVDINALTEMARVALHADDTKSAADLLRACEHLAFGALASASKETQIGDDLQDAIDGKYERLLESAAEHWDEQEDEPSEEITSIYEKTFAAAEAAYMKSAFRRALELVRAAEAISHVRVPQERLGDGELKRLLKS